MLFNPLSFSLNWVGGGRGGGIGEGEAEPDGNDEGRVGSWSGGRRGRGVGGEALIRHSGRCLPLTVAWDVKAVSQWSVAVCVSVKLIVCPHNADNVDLSLLLDAKRDLIVCKNRWTDNGWEEKEDARKGRVGEGSGRGRGKGRGWGGGGRKK